MKNISKVRKFFKKHITSLIFFMIILVIILIVIIVVSVLVPTARISQYGNRLAGIEEVLISKADLTKVTNEIEELEKIDDANIKISGRIVSIEIKLSPSTEIAEGKKVAGETIQKFDDAVKAYYDFQFFVTSVGEEGYTVIGYKTPDEKSLSWTNN